MQKGLFYGGILSVFFLITGFTACHSPTASKRLSTQNDVSSQHVPTPLPIFPDEEYPSLPDAPSFPSAPPIDTTLWDVSKVNVSKIDKNRKLIAFTFDDAPTRRLENLLAVYAEYNENNPDCMASATLFLNGYRFDKQASTLLSAALALDFELGNHTYSHADLTMLSPSEAAAEIERTDELLYDIDGNTHHLFRPPYGKITEEQKNAVSCPIINWTIDTLDWTGTSEENIYQTVMQNKFSGAIVLMHDGYDNTIEALKRLLPDLKAEGYQVVNVSQLSKAHACPLRNGKEYIRARKR